MNNKTRIIVFSTIISVLFILAITFNTFFTNAIGIQPTTLPYFAEKNFSIQINENKIEYILKDNQIILSNNKKLKLSDKFLNSFLNVKQPKYKKEDIMDYLYSCLQSEEEILNFSISDHNSLTLNYTFFKKKEELIVKLEQIVILEDKFTTKIYHAIIKDKNNLLRSINLLNKNINKFM